MRLAICVLLASACGTDGTRPKLKIADDHGTDVDEPSDLAFADGRLYTVSDRHSKIYALDRKGEIADEIDVAARDLEALARTPDGQFVIADEHDDKVWFVDDDGERIHAFTIDGVADGNSGIEGLAFDPHGTLYVAKEKGPARIYALDPAGHELARADVDVADLSALAWNPRDGHLYALSDEEHALVRLDRRFVADAAWRLPVDHPEGLAFDGDTLHVVSDSEERIYDFELVVD